MKNLITISVLAAGLGLLATGAACAKKDQPAPAASEPPGLGMTGMPGMEHGSGMAAMQHAAAPGTAPAQAAAKTAKELAPERLGQQATCPVTHETFTVTDETPAVEYQGKVYLFCCPMCAPQFLANPQQYGAPPPSGG